MSECSRISGTFSDWPKKQRNVFTKYKEYEVLNSMQTLPILSECVVWLGPGPSHTLSNPVDSTFVLDPVQDASGLCQLATC